MVAGLRSWFVSPFSALQLLSWLSLITSLYLVASGFRLIGLARAADVKSSNELIQRGIYSYIRHPLYSSLFFLALGAFLKNPTLFAALLMVGASFSLHATIEAEEEVDERKFGDRYAEYRRKTKMVIPFLY